MIGTSLIGAGLGVTQMIMGAKQAKEAKEALEEMERQKLENVTEGLSVSTLGSDLQREEAARLYASQIDALRGGGARTILGGMGRVEATSEKLNKDIASDLDRQQKEIDRMYAQDKANIRGMQESRENADIAGLSSQYTAGRQGMFDGMGNTLRAGSMAASGVPNNSGIIARETVSPVNKPAGVSDFSGYTPTTPMPNSFGSSRYGGSGMGGMNYEVDQFGNLIFK
jgi:hypothetical protein